MHLVLVYRLAAGSFTSRPRRRDFPVLRPLGDQPTLEMRDGAEHVKDQLTGGRGGVDLFLQAEQGDSTGLELFDDAEKLREGAAEAVEADNRQGVAFTRNVRGRMAALVRVRRIAAGIVLAADFSMLRTSLIAFTASVASSWLPCVGMMTRSARTHGRSRSTATRCLQGPR